MVNRVADENGRSGGRQSIPSSWGTHARLGRARANQQSDDLQPIKVTALIRVLPPSSRDNKTSTAKFQSSEPFLLLYSLLVSLLLSNLFSDNDAGLVSVMWKLYGM